MDNEILNIIIEKLYNMIEIDAKGNQKLYSYNISGNEMLYLLQKLDSDRFNLQIEMLKEAKENNE